MTPDAFGLLGLAERCRALGGTLIVDSMVAAGTALSLRMPVDPER